MAGCPEDRRVIRTKRLIRDAFTELIDEKGFDAITVRDITDKAEINRSTFYLHYQDKYDLLEQSEDEIIYEINEIIKFNPFNSNDRLNFNFQHEPYPSVLKLFEFLMENANFVSAVLGPKGDPAFQVKLRESIWENILQRLVNYLEKDELLIPVEILIAYVSSACIGVIQYWLDNGMTQSPREISIILSRVFFFERSKFVSNLT